MSDTYLMTAYRAWLRACRRDGAQLQDYPCPQCGREMSEEARS
jgi:hypothetical protein